MPHHADAAPAALATAPLVTIRQTAQRVRRGQIDGWRAEAPAGQGDWQGYRDQPELR